MAISLPPKGDTAKKLGSYFSPLKVEAQASPNMTVKVAEGSFWTEANEHMEYIGGTSPTISAPGTNAKWVLVTVTNTGMLNIVDGIASGTPQLPIASLYKDELPLAAVFVGDTTTTITNDMIYDLRPMWSIPPDSVSQSQLADFATKVYVDNADVLKADTTGTANANFTLNAGGANINDSGIYVDRFFGPDVAIRFNETAPIGSPPVATPGWEFTNDGATWNPIGVASGSYYTKSDLNGGSLDFLYYTKNDLNPVLPAAGVLDSRFYEQSLADATFAPISHMHVPGDITGLGDPVNTINGISPTLGNINLGLDELNDVIISGTTLAAVIRYDGTDYRNTILLIDDLGDVAITAPAVKDTLLWNGSVFLNRPLLKSDISDFSGSEFVLVTNVAGDPPVSGSPPVSNGTPQDIYGIKTFKDGVIIETSLTVTGNNTSIQTTELRVSDPHIDLNWQNAINNPTSFTSGMRVDRSVIAGSPSSAPAALMQWDENAGQWEFGVVGNTFPILGAGTPLTSTQVVDFGPRVTQELGLNNLNTMQDVTYTISPSTGEYLRYGATQWENKDFATDVTTELNANTLEQMQDVSYLGSPVVTSGEFLQWNGSQWVNHTAVKADISDFVEADYIHANATAEVKAGNLTINGDFTVGGGVGTVTTINSETVNIFDSVITLNAGETGNGVNGGSGTSGIEVDRGTAPDAYMWWSEIAKTWFATHTISTGSPASPVLTASALSFVGHDHVVTDISDLGVNASEINTLVGINTGLTVQAQLDDKISRTGDAMDNGANLTFAVAGEVLGLPAIPSVNDAATSKLYVDTQDTTITGLLNTHIADLTLHMTADQNAFLDGLTLTGSPVLTSSDVNQLIGISGNVQTLLDTKTDKLTPGVDNNLAALDIATGNIVDSGVVVNDAANSVNEIWTADKIDTTKADKIVPALVNNLAGLDSTGNLTDSGLILNDSGILVSEVWSALQIDTVKMDKQTGATVGNFGEFDASGNLIDGGNNPATFALTVHTHTSSEITDWATAFTAELNVNSIAALLDFTNNIPASGDFLRWSGSVWDNVASSGIAEFVRATGTVNEVVDGNKTFSGITNFQNNVTVTGTLAVNGNATILGNLTVQGDQIIQGEEIVTSNAITLNYGSTDPTTANGGGVILQRDVNLGSPPVLNAPNAVIAWDDPTSKWEAGLSNALQAIALENVTVAQPLYEIVTGTGNALYTLGFGVQAPAIGQTGVQVFVNGIKQIEGALKAYTVNYSNTSALAITFNAGSEPAASADVEFYGFGFIG